MAISYSTAVRYLFARQAGDIKLGLENIRRFVESLGHPENRIPFVHIAGTNGKGSTAALLASVLQKAGYKTGLYTSPHLIDMRERIRINGKPITKKQVLDFIEVNKANIEAADVSFFEILTGLAWQVFLEENVEIEVLETGLGGRLDATNLAIPMLTVITQIGLDHTHILGKTMRQIAEEKAGILKPGVPCISGIKTPRIHEHLMRIARSRGVEIFHSSSVKISGLQLDDKGSSFDARTPDSRYADLRLSLVGRHQIDNAAVALLTIDLLRRTGWAVPEEAVRRGLAEVSWPGRLQILSEDPRILIDAAHNPLGMRTLVKTLKSLFDYHRLILIFGVLEDKDYSSMTRQIWPLASQIILTRPLSERALDPERLLAQPWAPGAPKEVIPNIEEAFCRAISLYRKGDLICAAGSIYFIGEVLRIWKKKQRSFSP